MASNGINTNTCLCLCFCFCLTYPFDCCTPDINLAELLWKFLQLPKQFELRSMAKLQQLSRLFLLLIFSHHFSHTLRPSLFILFLHHVAHRHKRKHMHRDDASSDCWAWYAQNFCFWTNSWQRTHCADIKTFLQGGRCEYICCINDANMALQQTTENAKQFSFK